MIDNECEIEIQWGDCDPAGIVFFPNYFAWFDRSTWQMFARAGLPIDGLARDGRCDAMPLTHAAADFFAPCRPGDVLRIKSRVETAEGKRIQIAHEAHRGDVLILKGRETRAWVVRAPDRPSGMRGADIPADIVRRLNASSPPAA